MWFSENVKRKIHVLKMFYSFYKLENCLPKYVLQYLCNTTIEYYIRIYILYYLEKSVDIQTEKFEVWFRILKISPILNISEHIEHNILDIFSQFLLQNFYVL